MLIFSINIVEIKNYDNHVLRCFQGMKYLIILKVVFKFVENAISHLIFFSKFSTFI